MPEPAPRVVFDCNLFVQGIANRNSPARKALRLFFNGAILLFVSEPIISELRDVLNRPEIRHVTPSLKIDTNENICAMVLRPLHNEAGRLVIATRSRP